MASSQAILSAITNMQANAQGALPVLPNNGNPGGAYNMPHAAADQQAQPPAPDPYAWLQPSPFMQSASQMLEQMSARNQQRAATQEHVQPLPDPPAVLPAPPYQTAPVQAYVQPQAMPQQQVVPVLPQWAN
jgi:hypothetical protein